jgi:hypothetical protein
VPSENTLLLQCVSEGEFCAACWAFYGATANSTNTHTQTHTNAHRSFYTSAFVSQCTHTHTKKNSMTEQKKKKEGEVGILLWGASSHCRPFPLCCIAFPSNLSAHMRIEAHAGVGVCDWKNWLRYVLASEMRVEEASRRNETPYKPFHRLTQAPQMQTKRKQIVNTNEKGVGG